MSCRCQILTRTRVEHQTQQKIRVSLLHRLNIIIDIHFSKMIYMLIAIIFQLSQE